MTQELATAAKEGTFKSTAGLNIFFRSWRPDGPARTVIVIVQGFNSHSGYYGWVAEQLVTLDLAVYAVDLRGRGKSDGERFYVATFADYLSDVDAMVRLAKLICESFAFQTPAPDVALAELKGLGHIFPTPTCCTSRTRILPGIRASWRQ